MLATILSLLPGAFGLANNLTNAIANERIRLISAKTEEERIASQERINTLQMRRDVLLAESHSPWNSLMRFVLALGPAAILLKFLFWDKVVGSLSGCSGVAGGFNTSSCGWFRTDPLDVNQWWVITAVVGFYFLSEAVRKIRS